MTLLLNEAGVRYSSDPEYVHAARVAIRRARAAARLYKDYFRPKGIRRYLKLMRKTAQLLGAVRDLDVAIAKLLSYQKKSKRKAAGDLQHTLDGWMKKRADAHRDLVAWFDTKEYGEFVCDFLRFCRTPGAEILDLQPQTGVQVPPFQVRHVVPSMLLDNFAHVRCYEVCFEQGNDVQLPTLHQLRIECKYLRYNLEFVRDLLGDDSNGIIVDLKKLQDDLGDLNDAVVSKELLSDTGDGSNNDGLARYESAQNKAISKLRKQTYADFARFVGPENRARLLAAIANL
jgi:CHAD domain-containing protein